MEQEIRETEAVMETEEAEPAAPKMSTVVLMVNEFTVTKEVYMEYIKAIMKRYCRVYVVFGVVCLLLAIAGFGNEEPTQFLIMLVLSIFCFGAPVHMIYSSRDRKFAMQIEKNGGKPMERKAQFFEDHVEFFGNNGAHSVFGYEHITKVITSKNIYVMFIQKKIAMIIIKNSFTKGTLEEWKSLIASKTRWNLK